MLNDHPINNIKWVPRELLRANVWNPNKVASTEMKLLKQSILEDGWITAIVVQEVHNEEGEIDYYEIVDGFHRWTVSGDKEVQTKTGGLVPIVVVAVDDAHARISTIRINRARGSHGVSPMSSIIIELIDDLGLEVPEVCKRLSMEPEEVSRLYDRGNVLKRLAQEEFTEAWNPSK